MNEWSGKPQEEALEQRLEEGKEGAMAMLGEGGGAFQGEGTARAKEYLRNGKEFVWPEWREVRRERSR